MSRCFKDWLTAFCDYASFGEAPRRMYFWVGVSAVAGALRRKVWIDQAYFRWYPNFYIILVAPPGIVSKSTTAGISMNLLRRVPGIHFGPDVVTWQALIGAFAGSKEEVKYTEPSTGEIVYLPMSAMTIESSEFGNLLNPQDKDMVDLLVTLWDGKQGAFTKITKMSGNDSVENPWINIVACTTPAWIAGNFPEYMIGGGFTSRCLFVYADTKAKYVAYPGLEVPENLPEVERALVQDLEYIASNFVGAYTLDPAAVAWGEDWYRKHYETRPDGLDDERFGGYVARKQTHIHKLAMVIAAATTDKQIITAETLATANTMVTELEEDMPQVFAKIGRSEESVQAERLLGYIRKRGEAPYQECYRFIHAYFPDLGDFEGIISGLLKAGYVKLNQKGADFFLEADKDA